MTRHGLRYLWVNLNKDFISALQIRRVLLNLPREKARTQLSALPLFNDSHLTDNFYFLKEPTRWTQYFGQDVARTFFALMGGGGRISRVV